MNRRLTKGEIHLWLASLEPPADYLRQLWGLLSSDEQQRAERYHFEKDRDHFIASRGTLRCILSSYLDLAPEHLEFQYGSGGKPALTEACNPGNLRFNSSHSNDLGLYAILLHQEIGVDIEHVQAEYQNGVLVLLSHPLRAEIIATDLESLYGTMTEVLIAGLRK